MCAWKSIHTRAEREGRVHTRGVIEKRREGGNITVQARSERQRVLSSGSSSVSRARRHSRSISWRDFAERQRVLSSESSHLIRIIEHVLFLERRVPHGGSEPKLT